jgi:hypothetical protein
VVKVTVERSCPVFYLYLVFLSNSSIISTDCFLFLPTSDGLFFLDPTWTDETDVSLANTVGDITLEQWHLTRAGEVVLFHVTKFKASCKSLVTFLFILCIMFCSCCFIVPQIRHAGTVSTIYRAQFLYQRSEPQNQIYS